jgi:hypothetical protein
LRRAPLLGLRNRSLRQPGAPAADAGPRCAGFWPARRAIRPRAIGGPVSLGVVGPIAVTTGVGCRGQAVRGPDRSDSQADIPPDSTLSERIATWTTLFSCQGAVLPGDDHQIRRVAIWVAVRSHTAWFTEVRTSGLTCGANSYEPQRTRLAQAFNPRVQVPFGVPDVSSSDPMPVASWVSR